MKEWFDTSTIQQVIIEYGCNLYWNSLYDILTIEYSVKLKIMIKEDYLKI